MDSKHSEKNYKSKVSAHGRFPNSKKKSKTVSAQKIHFHWKFFTKLPSRL